MSPFTKRRGCIIGMAVLALPCLSHANTGTSAPVLAQSAPYQYAVADLGQKLTPVAINNQGTIIFNNGVVGSGAQAYILQNGATTPTPLTGFATVLKLNNNGDVLGSATYYGTVTALSRNGNVTTIPTSYAPALTGSSYVYGQIGGSCLNDNGDVGGNASTYGAPNYLSDNEEWGEAIIWNYANMTTTYVCCSRNTGAVVYGLNSSGIGLSYGSALGAVLPAGPPTDAYYIGQNRVTDKFDPLSINNSGQVAGSMPPAGNSSYSVEVSSSNYVAGGETMIGAGAPTKITNPIGGDATNFLIIGHGNGISLTLPPQLWYEATPSSTNGSGNPVAATFTRNGVNDLLPSNSGWTITSVADINDEAAMIGMGTKKSDQSTHAVLLVPAQITRQVDAHTGSSDAGYVSLNNTNNQLLIGQQVNLQLTLPSGITATNITWTLPGTTFKDYVIASDGSSATAPTQLQPNDLATPNVTFYWADAGTKQVTCTFTVFGVQTSITTNLTVFAPTATMNRTLGNVIQDGGSVIELNNIGAGLPGIQWNINVSLPSNFDPNASQWGLVQLVNLSRFFTVRTDATASMLQAVQATANPGTTIVAGGNYKALFDGVVSLDTSFPYVGEKNPCNGLNYTDLSDLPSSGGDAFSNTSINPAETFQTYLMFFPAGANSRPIPLRIVYWSWGGILDYDYTNATWQLLSPSQSATASPGLQWTPSLAFPTWNQTVTKNLHLISNN